MSTYIERLEAENETLTNRVLQDAENITELSDLVEEGVELLANYMIVKENDDKIIEHLKSQTDLLLHTMKLGNSEELETLSDIQFAIEDSDIPSAIDLIESKREACIEADQQIAAILPTE